MRARPIVPRLSKFAAVLSLVVLGSCALPTQSGYEAYGRGEYSRAMRLWMPHAESGDPTAQYLVGLLYDEGQGVEVDYERAARWYQRAAEQGHPAAQNNLGTLFLMGRGLDADPERACYWLTQASDQGFEQAQKNLSVVAAIAGAVEEEVVTGPVVAEVAGEEQMSPQALRAWGATLDVPEDQDYRALQWIRQCAKDGDPKSQFTLGRLYLSGANGLVADEAIAAGWFRKAAESGLAEAQTAYGLMCLRGQGVMRDELLAAHWLGEAAGDGDAVAQYNLGLMSLRGRGLAKSETRGVELVESAALQGLPVACMRVGMIHESGVAGTKDLVTATAWYVHAESLGDPMASAQVLRMRDALGADQFANAKNLAQAFHRTPASQVGLPAAPSRGN